MWTLHSFLSILNTMLNPGVGVLFKSQTKSYYSLLKTLIQWLPIGLRTRSIVYHGLQGPALLSSWLIHSVLCLLCFSFPYLFSAPGIHQALYCLRDYASTILSNLLPTPPPQPDPCLATYNSSFKFKHLSHLRYFC